MDNFCFLHQIDIFTPIGARELLKRQYFEAKYFWSKYFLKSLKLSISNRSGKINLVQKTKVVQNLILHQGPQNIFQFSNIFAIAISINLTQITLKNKFEQF